MRPGSRPLAWAAVLAAAVLAGCATPGKPAPAPPAAPAPVVAPPAPAPSTPRGLTIAAVGDIMMGTDYPENILPDDDGVGFLAGVTPTLAAADLTFGNLEGVLQDGGEPVKQCKDKRVCFLFRTPARYAAYLRVAGFDVMSLANNHARDFGETGRSASMAALDAVGLHHSGREGTSTSFVVDGRRIAMIAYAPNVGSNQLNDPALAAEQVRFLAEHNDIVIVSFHGGAEGNGAEVLTFAREIFVGEDRGNVVEFAHAMIDAGADLVLGHGPHVVRAMELYRDRLIAYSLGNFATYYGISVEGIRGQAPILMATLADDGRFLSGKIESTVQLRPAGPTLDPAQSVLHQIKQLTDQAFPGGVLAIGDDGSLAPRPHAESP
jgi:poly-gamma-glutamate capsule biosynthesis protein CapA/YwtB (metallophosphatase superfamily)